MCFRLIDAKKAQHPVSRLCAVLGVSRAGYYAWKDRPTCERRRRDRELLDAIRAVHADSKATYGWPRIHAELRRQGILASRKRVARLMRAAGLSGLVAPRQGRAPHPRPGGAAPRAGAGKDTAELPSPPPLRLRLLLCKKKKNKIY